MSDSSFIWRKTFDKLLVCKHKHYLFLNSPVHVCCVSCLLPTLPKPTWAFSSGELQKKLLLEYWYLIEWIFHQLYSYNSPDSIGCAKWSKRNLCIINQTLKMVHQSEAEGQIRLTHIIGSSWRRHINKLMGDYEKMMVVKLRSYHLGKEENRTVETHESIKRIE